MTLRIDAPARARPITLGRRPWTAACLVLSLATLPGSASAQLVGSQCEQLVGSGSAGSEEFGADVDTDGVRVIAGAAKHASSAGAAAGGAWIFHLVGGSWVEEAALPPPGSPAPTEGDHYGRWVAIDGDHAVVGARYDDTAGDNAGAVYVYEFDDGLQQWVFEAKLIPAAVGSQDHLGEAVAISGDTIVAGAPTSDLTLGNEGAVYVFELQAGAWNLVQTLSDPAGGLNDQFGYAVDVDGGLIVVGSQFDDGLAPGADSGSAFIYEWNGSTWLLASMVEAPDAATGDEFGFAVAADDDAGLVVVGSPFDDDQGDGSGSAYVWSRSSPGGTWDFDTKLVDSDGEAADQLGQSVTIDGDHVVCGIPKDDLAASDGGSALVFDRADSWSVVDRFTACDPDATDRFGGGVAAADGLFACGAQHAAAGDTGAAYVNRLVPTPWTNLGLALPGSQGEPTLWSTGALVPNCLAWLQLEHGLPGGSACLVLGLSRIDAPLFGGTLVPNKDVLLCGFPLDGSGAISIPYTWPAGVPVGASLWLQAWMQDPAGVKGWSATNGLQGTQPAPCR